MFSKENKKIKVLIVINDFFVGGAQKLISEQVKSFNKDLMDLSLVTLFKDSKRSNLYNTLPKDLPVFNIGMKSAYDILGWVKIIKILIKIKPKVVFSHLFLSNAVFRFLKPFFGYKIFTVEHNTYKNKSFFHLCVDRILSPFSDRIIAVSNEVGNLSVRQFKVSCNKVVVIPNGIDLMPIERYKNITKLEMRKKLFINEDEKIFLSVGRLTPQKNQKLLVDSFLEFSKKHNNTKLFVLGEGTLLEELKKRGSDNDSIVFMGNIENVFDFYKASDFLVSTSLIEGMSMAYLEALAFGLPIIATKTGGTGDLIINEENGFFIPNVDLDSTVKTLEKAITSNYSFLGERAKESSEYYKIERNTKSYEDLIFHS